PCASPLAFCSLFVHVEAATLLLLNDCEFFLYLRIIERLLNFEGGNRKKYRTFTYLECVDAYHFAVAVEQRTTAISVINRGAMLEPIRVVERSPGFVADDSRGNGSFHANRAADCID